MPPTVTPNSTIPYGEICGSGPRLGGLYQMVGIGRTVKRQKQRKSKVVYFS